MALFGKRNKQRDDVPEEIQEYYDAEESDRTGVAWLLAFATLVVTILLAAGIFFAGRWTYHKIAGTDKNKSTETAQNESNQQANKQNEQSTNSSSQNEGSGNLEEEKRQPENKILEKPEKNRINPPANRLRLVAILVYLVKIFRIPALAIH